jgi:hypothetical protein
MGPLTTGCFHSVIDTGLQPGPVGYAEEWETAWLIGAVPARVNATEACQGPWARVETQQSFLNGIVTVLTVGIYAPHQVEVTCARTDAGASSQEESGSASR